MECQALQDEESFVSLPGMLDFRKNIDLYKDIILLTQPCGYGKTTWVFHHMLNTINAERKFLNNKVEDLKREDALFVSFRKGIVEQQLSEPKNQAKRLLPSKPPSFLRTPEKMWVETGQQIGRKFKQGKRVWVPEVIVIDEIHTLFRDAIFAEDLMFFLLWLIENREKMIVIGITATPDYLFDYIAPEFPYSFNFKIADAAPAPVKHKVKNLKILFNGRGTTVLNNLNINEKNKVIFFEQSAIRCMEHAQKRENSLFFVSPYCESVKRSKGGEEDIIVLDEMNNQKTIIDGEDVSYRDLFLKTAAIPDGYNIVFLNAAYMEGINIKQPGIINEVICESVDLITIIQFLGRLRHDINNFYVIVNHQYFNITKQSYEEAQELLKALKKVGRVPAKEQEILEKRFSKQKENDKLSKLVYKFKDKYELNILAFIKLSYDMDCYNRIYQDTDVVVKKYFEDNPLRTIKPREDYFKQLQKFSDNPIELTYVKDIIIEESKKTAAQIWEEIKADYIGIESSAEKIKTLAHKLGLKDERGRVVGKVATLKYLKGLGYSSNTRQVARLGGKRMTTIYDKNI